MHVLIIEDDSIIANNLQEMFGSSNITSTIAANGEEGVYQTEIETYDAIVLDWVLPDKEGIEICKQIRASKNTIPIIMLTAKSQLEDKILGLETGADDYITKPFVFEELLARIKTVVRRKIGGITSSIIAISDLTLDINTQEVKRGGKKISLAPREYALLEYLALNKGRVVDRMELLHHVWGEEIDPLSNTIDVHIKYLRNKIDFDFNIKLIKTVKGKGYMICKN